MGQPHCWKESRQFIDDGVYRIVLDRPAQRNALTPVLYGEVKTGLLIAETDPEIDCIVIEGAGGCFASGGDLKVLLDVLDEPPVDRLSSFVRAYDEPLPFRSMLECTKPVVAKIDGLCLAGGVILAAAADVAIASHHSVFGIPEGRVGVLDGFSTVLLPRLIGLARARYLILSGRTISASEAAAWGLIVRAVPPEGLEDEVQEVVKDLRAGSPDSFSAYKRALNVDLEGLSPLELYRVVAGQNCREGLSAFVERRPPCWRRADLT